MNSLEEIDYSKYGLKDLYDCSTHIDKEKYPERYQRILEVIRTKEVEKTKSVTDHAFRSKEKENLGCLPYAIGGA